MNRQSYILCEKNINRKNIILSANVEKFLKARNAMRNWERDDREQLRQEEKRILNEIDDTLNNV